MTVKVAKFRGRNLRGCSGDIEDYCLDFSIVNDVGIVYNGAWDFNVIEFKPPYMKILVLMPFGRTKEVEYHNVVACKI